jgi:hypothetical protein
MEEETTGRRADDVGLEQRRRRRRKQRDRDE